MQASITRNENLSSGFGWYILRYSWILLDERAGPYDGNRYAASHGRQVGNWRIWAAKSTVTINALDAQGLYATNVDASEQSRGSSLASGMPVNILVFMSLNEDVMTELADGTGAPFFITAMTSKKAFGDSQSFPNGYTCWSFH